MKTIARIAIVAIALASVIGCDAPQRSIANPPPEPLDWHAVGVSIEVAPVDKETSPSEPFRPEPSPHPAPAAVDSTEAQPGAVAPLDPDPGPDLQPDQGGGQDQTVGDDAPGHPVACTGAGCAVARTPPVVTHDRPHRRRLFLRRRR